jgi:very-short-patch-repair endonuclease
LHGLDLVASSTVIDVTVPLGSRRGAPGARVHRADLAFVDRDPRTATTSLLRTLIDCGRTLPLLHAVVMLDSALHHRYVTAAALRAAGESARGHGSAALRRAVRYADELADSPLESALRLLLDITGAQVRSQVWISGVGRVDFLIDGWLVIEADGFAFHADRAAYRNDRRRANVLAERGHVLLRFTWEDVRGRPAWVLAQVERTRGAGARGVGVVCGVHDEADGPRSISRTVERRCVRAPSQPA